MILRLLGVLLAGCATAPAEAPEPLSPLTCLVPPGYALVKVEEALAVREALRDLNREINACEKDRDRWKARNDCS